MLDMALLYRIGIIITPKNSGTFFIMKYNGKSIFITAYHVIENCNPGDNLTLQFSNVEWNIALNKIIHANDICVFHVSNELDISYRDEPYGMGGILFGQDVYYAGYPFGWNIRLEVKDLKTRQLTPFVKKGVLSQFDDARQRFYLDTVCDRGFSGSPVIFYKGSGLKNRSILGVMSAQCLDPNGKPAGLSTCVSMKVFDLIKDQL